MVSRVLGWFSWCCQAVAMVMARALLFDYYSVPSFFFFFASLWVVGRALLSACYSVFGDF